MLLSITSELLYTLPYSSCILVYINTTYTTNYPIPYHKYTYAIPTLFEKYNSTLPYTYTYISTLSISPILVVDICSRQKMKKSIT